MSQFFARARRSLAYIHTLQYGNIHYGERASNHLQTVCSIYCPIIIRPLNPPRLSSLCRRQPAHVSVKWQQIKMDLMIQELRPQLKTPLNQQIRGFLGCLLLCFVCSSIKWQRVRYCFTNIKSVFFQIFRYIIEALKAKMCCWEYTRLILYWHSSFLLLWGACVLRARLRNATCWF